MKRFLPSCSAARLALAGLSTLLMAFVGATGAAAQSWQSQINDSGALMSGYAFIPGNTLAFSCTAPSPSGRPMIETGDHEAQRTDTPFTMTVMVGPGLLDPSADDSDIRQLLMTLAGTTYGLPPMPWDEFYGNWFTTLSMSDPLFSAARASDGLVLDPGRGTAYTFPVDGLAEALVTAMGYCITGWQLVGFTVPQDLVPVLLAAESMGAPHSPASSDYAPVRSSQLPDGYQLAPLMPLPPTHPPQRDAHLTALCQGAWSSDPNYEQVSDLDGDGREDYVLDWSGVECQGAISGRVFCGAANCRIDVFLSSRDYANPVEFLGMGMDVVQDTQGRVGLLLTGTPFVCSDGFCDKPFYWTGTDFAQ